MKVDFWKVKINFLYFVCDKLYVLFKKEKVALHNLVEMEDLFKLDLGKWSPWISGLIFEGHGQVGQGFG